MVWALSLYKKLLALFYFKKLHVLTYFVDAIAQT